MYNIDTKSIVVNSDTQVILREEDGTTYADNDVTPTAAERGFILEGFLGLVMGTELNVLKPQTRIIKTSASTGTAEVLDYVLTATANVAGSVLRIVYQSLNLSPVESQNIPLEMRYQIPANATTDTIGADIVSTINNNPSSPVTAAYTAGTDTLRLTAKQKGVTFRLYATETLWTAAPTVVAAAALPVNTYDDLKNLEWARNIDIDRNLNWAPLPGVSYTSYYFEVVRVPPYKLGNNPLPNERHAATITGYTLYVSAAAATLLAALDFLVGDVNIGVGS